MPLRSLFAAAVLVPAIAAGSGAGTRDDRADAVVRAPLPVIGHACEGCEAVFDGMPATIPARARIAPADQPGAPMTVSGRVLDRSGRARAGVIVYAYQTDHAGRYPKPRAASDAGAMRHGRLRAWVRSDAQGRYAFDTIRPGAYPGEDIPEHIHMQVVEPGCFTYFIDDVVFRDDPRLTPAQERQLVQGVGGAGLVVPRRSGDGVWQVERDIVLGQGVPGYRECRAR